MDFEKDYDVVIAGGGPAGSQAARDLARRDYSVVVLEAQSEIDGMKQSTGGTFPRMMTEFGVPDDVAMHQTDKVVLESQNEDFSIDQTGYVLEFGDFKEYLMEDAEKQGAEYRLGSPVRETVQENDEVKGVKYSGENGIEEVFGDITIDATGDSAILTRDLGLWNPDKEKRAVGLEYEMEGVDMDYEDHMLMGLDSSIAPGGYYWIFHTGEETAKAGVCWINQKFEEHGGDGTIQEYLDEWLENDSRFENAEKIEEERHAGSAYFEIPENMVDNGFMSVGDTISSIDPLWGEGIHKCMQSGRSAAITAENALEQSNTSTETLSHYEQLWHNDVAEDRNSRMLMSEILYSLEDNRLDSLLSDLDEMSREEVSELNDGNVRKIMSMAEPGDLNLVKEFGTDAVKIWMNDHIPRYNYKHNIN